MSALDLEHLLWRQSARTNAVVIAHHRVARVEVPGIGSWGVRGTGEKRYVHEHFAHPLRANGRRSDVPAKLLSRLNQLIKMQAANDPR